MLKYLFFDLDTFYYSCEKVRHADIIGKPTGIVHYAQSGMHVLSNTSYEARRIGVRNGSPLAAARNAAIESNTDFYVIREDLRHYFDVSKGVMHIIREEAPEMSVESIDEAAAQIEDEWDELRLVRERVRERVKREFDITISTAGAYSKYAAKIMTNLYKPDQDSECRSIEDYVRETADLPTSEIMGVGERRAEILAEHGINTIGQLANARYLPFGSNTNRELVEKAQGTYEWTFMPWYEQIRRIPRGVGNSSGLRRKEWENKGAYHDAVGRAFFSVYSRLYTAGLAARTITVKARNRETQTHQSKQYTLQHPTQDYNTLEYLLHRAADEVWEAPIDSVRVEAHNFVRGSWQHALPQPINTQKEST